jgi:hypothetical protein
VVCVVAKPVLHNSHTPSSAALLVNFIIHLQSSSSTRQDN